MSDWLNLTTSSLLFTGLLINKDTLGKGLEWLLTISFFHSAFEGLAVNELRYLQLKEVRVGISSSDVALRY